MTAPLNTHPSDVNWLHLAQSIGRLDGKVDQFLATNRINKESIDDHEVRLRHLEKGDWKRVGIAAGVSSLIGFVLAVLPFTGVFPS